MSSHDFYIKQGDTSPALEAVLVDEDGDPVDLTGSTCRFRMMQYGRDELAIDNGVELIDPEAGEVAYQWTAADTETPGDFRGEFAVDHDGETGDSFDADETFPNVEYLSIKIEERIA
jgi:hypothetical protein